MFLKKRFNPLFLIENNKRREWIKSKYLENMFDGSCRSNGREEEERDEEILDCERHCSCKDMKKSSLLKGMISCGTLIVCAYLKKRKSCDNFFFWNILSYHAFSQKTY